MSIWANDEKRGRIGGAGQLLAGVIARVIKPDGSLCSLGEPGELIVKSPSNALCYFNNEQAYVTTDFAKA